MFAHSLLRTGTSIAQPARKDRVWCIDNNAVIIPVTSTIQGKYSVLPIALSVTEWYFDERDAHLLALGTLNMLVVEANANTKHGDTKVTFGPNEIHADAFYVDMTTQVMRNGFPLLGFIATLASTAPWDKDEKLDKIGHIKFNHPLPSDTFTSTGSATLTGTWTRRADEHVRLQFRKPSGKTGHYRVIIYKDKVATCNCPVWMASPGGQCEHTLSARVSVIIQNLP